MLWGGFSAIFGCINITWYLDLGLKTGMSNICLHGDVTHVLKMSLRPHEQGTLLTCYSGSHVGLRRSGMSSSAHAFAFTNSGKVTHHAVLFWDPEWPNARESHTLMCHFPALLECVAVVAREWID